MKKVYIFLIAFFALNYTSVSQQSAQQTESALSGFFNPSSGWDWGFTPVSNEILQNETEIQETDKKQKDQKTNNKSFTIQNPGSQLVNVGFNLTLSDVRDENEALIDGNKYVYVERLSPEPGTVGGDEGLSPGFYEISFTGGTGQLNISLDHVGINELKIDIYIILPNPPFNSGFIRTQNVSVKIVDFLWTGNIDSDWDDNNNWNPNGIPGSDDCISIPSTANDPVISNTVSFKSLCIETGAKLTISNGVNVSLLNSDREFTIEENAEFILQGNFSSAGTLSSFGNFIIESTGQLINTGVLNLEAGEIVNSGHFINIVDENPGTINALGGSLIIEPNAKMDGDGSAIQNFTDVSFLEIKSDATGTGSFIHTSAGVSATVQRYMTGQQFHVISPPVSGQTIEAFIDNNVNIAKNSSGQYALRHYDPASGWSDFYTDQTTGDMLSGTAYAVALDGDGVVSFEGTLRRSNIDIDIPYQSGAFGWNGVGNPFVASIGARSAASVNDFLTQNSTQLAVGYEAIYLYDPTREEGTRYHIINNAGGSLIDYLSIGQGFIVKAKDASSSVTFDPNMRSHQPDDFYKQDSDESPWHSLRLVATSGQKRGHTFVSFNEQMTPGLDVTYDAAMYVEDASFHIYTHMPEGSSDLNLGIQALPDYGFETMLIPVGLQTASGGDVTFSLAENILPGYLVPVLEDHELGIYTDLSMQNYTVNVDAGSDPLGRFFLRMVNMSSLYTIHFGVDGQGGSLTAELEDGTPVFPGDEFPYGTGINFTATANEGYTVKEWTINGNIQEDFYGHELSYDHLLGDLQVMVAFEETATTVIEPFTDSEVIIYTFENYIYIKGNLGENTRAVLYDTMGRAILSKQLLISETNKINVKGLTTGVYVLHILGEKQQISEKILIR